MESSNTYTRSADGSNENVSPPDVEVTDIKTLSDKIEFASNHFVSNACGDGDESSVKQNTVGSERDDMHSETPFITLSQTEFSEHTSPIVSCRFSSDNNLVASLDLEGTLRVWQCH